MRRFPTENRGAEGDRSAGAAERRGKAGARARLRWAICIFCADVTRSIVHCLSLGLGLGFINRPIGDEPCLDGGEAIDDLYQSRSRG